MELARALSNPMRWPTVELSSAPCTWHRCFSCLVHFWWGLSIVELSHKFYRRHSRADPGRLVVRIYCTDAGSPTSRRRRAEGRGCNRVYLGGEERMKFISVHRNYARVLSLRISSLSAASFSPISTVQLILSPPIKYSILMGRSPGRVGNYNGTYKQTSN